MEPENGPTPEGDRMDNWKQFQGTELGGLLGRIYSNDRPKISYPKPKVKPQEPRAGFIPGGSKAGADDPRKSTRRKVCVVDLLDALSVQFRLKERTAISIDCLMAGEDRK